MSDRIEVNDPVMVWRGCPFCGHTMRLGYTFTVAKMVSGLRGTYFCCNTASVERVALEGGDHSQGWPERCLKKLKGLPEQESIDVPTTTKAPNHAEETRNDREEVLSH